MAGTNSGPCYYRLKYGKVLPMNELERNHNLESELRLGIINDILDQTQKAVVSNPEHMSIASNGAFSPDRIDEEQVDYLMSAMEHNLGQMQEMLIATTPRGGMVASVLGGKQYVLQDPEDSKYFYRTTIAKTTTGSGARSATLRMREDPIEIVYQLYADENGGSKAIRTVEASEDEFYRASLPLYGPNEMQFFLRVYYAAAPPDQLDISLLHLKEIVMQKYDEADADNYIAEMRHRYEQVQSVREMERQLGGSPQMDTMDLMKLQDYMDGKPVEL